MSSVSPLRKVSPGFSSREPGTVGAAREARTRRHVRAYRDRVSRTFADGTLLVFGGGRIRMRSDEWFTAQDVEAAFVSVLRGEPLPGHIRWRDISGSLRV